MPTLDYRNNNGIPEARNSLGIYTPYFEDVGSGNSNISIVNTIREDFIAIDADDNKVVSVVLWTVKRQNNEENYSLQGELGHCGILALRTDNLIPSFIILSNLTKNPGGTPLNQYPFTINNILLYQTLFRITAITGIHIDVGISEMTATTANHTYGIYFELDPIIYGDNNWRCVCKKLGIATIIDSGIAAVANIWHTFRIQIDESVGINGESTFYIDNVLVGTINDINIPIGFPGCYNHRLINTAANIEELHIDHIITELYK